MPRHVSCARHATRIKPPWLMRVDTPKPVPRCLFPFPGELGLAVWAGLFLWGAESGLVCTWLGLNRHGIVSKKTTDFGPYLCTGGECLTLFCILSFICSFCICCFKWEGCAQTWVPCSPCHWNQAILLMRGDTSKPVLVCLHPVHGGPGLAIGAGLFPWGAGSGLICIWLGPDWNSMVTKKKD